ncbi:DUF6304 family protein [Streptomyces sp. NPDC000594]|uniref:DUF6304 family protein n=1 Tax=Streptomyces sp. NPDC000594 TaxID=3154261 RepID=UPI00331964C4
MSSESTEVWAGWYRDRRGAEAVTIAARGPQLRTRIRGVEYEGASLSALEAVGAEGVLLSACVLEWDIPVPLHADGAVERATLSCLLTLGELRSEGALDRADLNLTLHYGGAAFEAGVAGGDFDRAFARIREQLPAGVEPGAFHPADA